MNSLTAATIVLICLFLIATGFAAGWSTSLGKTKNYFLDPDEVVLIERYSDSVRFWTTVSECRKMKRNSFEIIERK